MDRDAARRLHAAAFWLLAGLCAWFAVRGYLDALEPRGGDVARELGGSDLPIYWRAGRAVLAGQDPNGVVGWIYPPGAAVPFAPFAALPLAAFAALFQLASLAALLFAARALPLLVRDAGLPAPAWLAWAPLAIVLRCADSNLSNGQVNHFTLAAIVAALAAWRIGRERAAGAWIGAAAAFKVHPGVLALAFATRRAWRAVAWSALAALVGFVAIPCVALGPADGWASLARWSSDLAAPHALGGTELIEAREYLPGQSLPAALYRLLAAAPATARGAEGPTAAIAHLSPDIVRWIVLAAQVALAAALVATLLRSCRSERAGARLREVALCLTAVLLVAPLAHKAHFVWLLVPYAALLAGAPVELGVIALRARWTLVVLSALSIGLTTPFLLNRALATAALSRNAVGLGALLAFLALGLDVWARTRRECARSGT